VTAYVVRRLIAVLPVMLVVATVSFVLIAWRPAIQPA
jgi:ABC-type microcin C transport system permease subunit YejB